MLALLSAGLLSHPRLALAGAGEAEDYSTTPFTDYGEFNETAEEEDDMKFLQYGRLFGFSVGAGFQGVTGDRGLLWGGGVPLIDIAAQYWFDFNTALDLDMYFVQHNYVTASQEAVRVNFVRLGMDFKYYFDTKNLSAPISFANPYLLAGFGAYNKGEFHTQLQQSNADTAMGISLGGGLEFTVKPRKTYIAVQGALHFARFSDYNSADNQAVTGAQDLAGYFYTVSVNAMFTW